MEGKGKTICCPLSLGPRGSIVKGQSSFCRRRSAGLVRWSCIEAPHQKPPSFVPPQSRTCGPSRRTWRRRVPGPPPPPPLRSAATSPFRFAPVPSVQASHAAPAQRTPRSRRPASSSPTHGAAAAGSAARVSPPPSRSSSAPPTAVRRHPHRCRANCLSGSGSRGGGRAHARRPSRLANRSIRSSISAPLRPFVFVAEEVRLGGTPRPGRRRRQPHALNGARVAQPVPIPPAAVARRRRKSAVGCRSSTHGSAGARSARPTRSRTQARASRLQVAE